MMLGEFIPNILSSDYNANARTEVMRCKMVKSKEAYMTLARTHEEVTVEILREETVLSRFKVPWSTRVQSRFLTRPDDPVFVSSTSTANSNSNSNLSSETDSRPGPRSRILLEGTSRHPRASKHDPWKGFDERKPGVWERDKLYMCVPGMETPLSRKVSNVPLNFINVMS
jgi:hypothetical protein